MIDRQVPFVEAVRQKLTEVDYQSTLPNPQRGFFMSKEQTELLGLLTAFRIKLRNSYKSVPLDLTQTLEEISNYIVENEPEK